MEIATKQLKRVTVVDIGGWPHNNGYRSQLEAALGQLIEEGHYNLVIDMADLDALRSRELRALLATRKAAQRWRRGDVRLACVPDHIRETLELVGFTQLFDIYDDLIAAVGSY